MQAPADTEGLLNMKTNLHDIVKEFMLLEAPSGYESKMAYAMKAHLEAFSHDVHMDRAGNVLAKFPGRDPAAPTIMVFAHMDQLGFIVRKIEKDGLIQVDRMGGIPEKVLPALKLSIRGIDGNYTTGVFGVKSHHQATAEEKYKVDVVTSLFVDIGAKSAEDVKAAGIHVGCPAIYEPNFYDLQNGRVCGTAVDNRCGCAALVGIAEQISSMEHDATIYVVGTVWEEFNIRGAVFAARAIKPDLAIGMDVVMCGDTPDLAGKYDIGFGKGPAVGLYNFHGRGTLNGCIGHAGLYKHALHCAEESGIPLQEFASLGMLTDTAYVQMENNYVGCLDMGFPARYTHTPSESAQISDVEQLAELVSKMVTSIHSDFQVSRF